MCSNKDKEIYYIYVIYKDKYNHSELLQTGRTNIREYHYFSKASRLVLLICLFVTQPTTFNLLMSPKYQPLQAVVVYLYL